MATERRSSYPFTYFLAPTRQSGAFTFTVIILDGSTFLQTSFATYLLVPHRIYKVHPNGHDIWSIAKDDIYFMLSHPNGWEGKKQNQMRKAAVKAGLVPDTPVGEERVSFVTEGEASLHFAIENGVCRRRDN